MGAVTSVSGRNVLVDGAFVAATVTITDARVAEVAAYDPAADGVQAPDSAYVLPGIVDTHVHVNEPGRTHWEGFTTATRAASLGGVTTVVDMPLNSIPPTTTVAGLDAKQAATRGQLAIDVGLWGGAVPGNLADLAPLWERGVFGFKCFLSPSGVDEFPPLDPAGFEAAMAEVARLDALMIVHAEDPAVLDASPAPSSRAYSDFLLSRPDGAEVDAIKRVIRTAAATGARAHVLHLSSARALDLIKDARDDGVRLTVETCPHYLTFAAEAIPDAAAQFKCCPPIRDAGNRDELWQALRDGLIDVVVTDHSPATAEEKTKGGGDLQQAWGGIAGLQVGFTAIAHEARRRGFDLADVSRWMSTSTADLVGLTHKGRIAVGADADLAVYDTAVPLEVHVAELAHKNPISAYDGLRLDGRVTHTVSRGVLSPGHEHGRVLVRP